MQTKIQEPIKELISNITSKLISLYPDVAHAQNRAWLILQFVTNYTKAQLLANSQINITELHLKNIEQIIHLHVNHHKPIQYILKNVPFLNLDIILKPGTLIPRPETENWCNNLIEAITDAHLGQPPSLTILDLCTGTGCIGLALAKTFPQSTVYALDISNDAYHLTKANALHNDIQNIIVLKSDLYKKLPQDIKFDLIVSNPPYISYKRWKTLDPMVKKWENANALTAKRSGTFLIKKIIKEAPRWLKSNPLLKQACLPQLILEMDDNQAKKISKLLKHYGFSSIMVKKDMADMDRVIEASLKK